MNLSVTYEAASDPETPPFSVSQSAALFLIAMREQGKGRPVRAGTILTVSDVLREASAGETPDEWTWLPREELRARIDRTIGAALAAAAALGR